MAFMYSLPQDRDVNETGPTSALNMLSYVAWSSTEHVVQLGLVGWLENGKHVSTEVRLVAWKIVVVSLPSAT